MATITAYPQKTKTSVSQFMTTTYSSRLLNFALVQLLLCLILLSQVAVGFNLDYEIPLIKTGPKGSYFGFSVAQHVQTVNGVRTLMLVGAPKANSTEEKLKDITRPGALYSCMYNTNKEDQCQQVETGQDANDQQWDFTDQWLGVSLQSSNDLVVVCAHRYVSIDGENRRGLGMCYSFTEELDYNDFWEPCGGKPTEKGHKEYGLCQAGSSVAIADQAIVFGAPGSYDWTGSIMRFSSDDSQSGWYYSPVKDDVDPALAAPVKLNSYLGMSVTTGKFIGSEMIYVAGAPRSNTTGEVHLFETKRPDVLFPIKKLQGEKIASSFGYQVCKADLNNDQRDDLIVGAPFYFGKKKGGAVYVYMHDPVKNSIPDTPTLKLYGKADSRFGFSIASAGDVNRDGFEDLVIGAPYEGDGVVYLYHGSTNGISDKPSQIIKASDMSSKSASKITTFGYSLSGGHDLDQNTYPDLLVGAFGSDQVILLRGRPIMNIDVEIRDMPDPIDANSAKKCADGKDLICFKFKACYKYTTKPNDKFDATPKIKYKITAEKDEAGPPRVEFKEKDSVIGSIVEGKLELRPQSDDKFVCKEETVYILPGVRDFLNPFNFDLEFELEKRKLPGRSRSLADVNDFPVLDTQGKGPGLVKSFAVEFQKECSVDKICQSDLRVQAKAYEEIEPNSSGRPKGSPISQLSVGQVTKFYLHIDLKNKKEPAYETNLYVTVPSVLYYVQTYSEGPQYSCAPISAETVKCEIANPFPKNEQATLTMEFDPGDIDAKQNVIKVYVKANTTSTEISPDNNERELEVKVIIKADLKLEGFVDNDAQIFYKGDIIGESAVLFADQIGPVVRHKYLLSNNGPGKVSNCSVRIQWPYEVMSNYPQGKHLLYLMEIPEVKGGVKGKCYVDPKHVNFLDVKPPSPSAPNEFVAAERRLEERVRRTPIVGLDASDSSALEFYGGGNPFFDDPNHKLSRRKRVGIRDAAFDEQIVKSMEILDNDGKKRQVVIMDCAKGTAKCFEIRCEVHDLTKEDDVSIAIESRLWQSTLIEDYPEVYRVDIYSRARVEIPKELNIQQEVSNDKAYALTFAYSDIKGEEKEIPLWVIIVASLCGLLLLIIIILILWCIGFFKRKRPGDLHQAEKQKAKKNSEYAEPL